MGGLLGKESCLKAKHVSLLDKSCLFFTLFNPVIQARFLNISSCFSISLE